MEDVPLRYKLSPPSSVEKAGDYKESDWCSLQIQEMATFEGIRCNRPTNATLEGCSL